MNSRSASITIVNPLECPAWDSLVAKHSESCFFHSAAWARVLHETYGHQPLYFCRLSQGQLETMLPVMEVVSPLTGRRGVSLPFSDFCPALRATNTFDEEIVACAMERGLERRWRYLEFRGAHPEWRNSNPSLQFYSHVINLNSGPESLFRQLDESVRRGVRKAEKAGLQIEFSTTFDAMKTFFALHGRTRQRHGLPPQPVGFFESIVRNVLAKGQGFIATVKAKNRAISSAVFFHDGRKAIYKFGASDFEFQQMRPNNFLMWEAIQHCAGLGLVELHLGRTSLANDGLRRFKAGFGATEEKINYFKYDFTQRAFVNDIDRAESWVNRFFGFLPLPLLRLSGRVLYPHLS